MKASEMHPLSNHKLSQYLRPIKHPNKNKVPGIFHLLQDRSEDRILHSSTLTLKFVVTVEEVHQIDYHMKHKFPNELQLLNSKNSVLLSLKKPAWYKSMG